MDIKRILTNLPHSIGSRDDLDLAFSDLLAAIEKTGTDIPSILNTLTGITGGLVEAALTSRNHNAFRFRDRLLNEARKSSSSLTPTLRTTAECLGTFLVELPQGAVDRSVVESFNAFTDAVAVLSTLKSRPTAIRPQREPNIPAGLERGARGSRKKDASASPLKGEITSRQISANDSHLVVKASEQMARFFKNVFTNCVNPETEEFSMNNLLAMLAATASQSSSLNPEQALPPSPAPYLPLRFSDIVNYWQDARHCKPGDWPVIISQRAIRHIKSYISSNDDMFKRIHQKIKQLSVGFFSPQNQKKLLNEDFGVPIYTADLSDDLLLIYQVDFGAPTSAGQESQFIRIFGVFQKSQIDARFWGAIAAVCARRGSEYVKRCSDRAETQPRFKGVETTPPKSFPPLDLSPWQGELHIDVDACYFLDLHRALVVETFVPFSQTLFDAIQRQDEPNFMFAVS